MIEVRDISFNFGDARIFSDVSLEVDETEIVGILGPSGIGKTTLLRCIAGLLSPSNGEVLIDNLAPQVASQAQKVGFLFQQDSLLEWRTIEENVSLPFEAAGVSLDSEILNKIKVSLELVGLHAIGKKFPRQLSGGMRQRVALARALAPGPAVLLLDEPFAAIDLLTRERIMIELHEILRRSRTPAIVVTHHIEEAIFLSDRVVLLGDSPARIVDEAHIPFGFHRDAALMERKEFIDQVSQVKVRLRSAEAMSK